MLIWNYLFTLRAYGFIENLQKNSDTEDLELVGELFKQYIVSSDRRVLNLQGNFSKKTVFYVLNQLGVKDYTYEVSFPDSTTTTIRFK